MTPEKKRILDEFDNWKVTDLHHARQQVRAFLEKSLDSLIQSAREEGYTQGLTDHNPNIHTLAEKAKSERTQEIVEIVEKMESKQGCISAVEILEAIKSLP